MSEDIVERLQALVVDIGNPDIDDDLLDAKSEIERLRAEIECLRGALEKIAQHDMQAIAMDALRPGERIRAAGGKFREALVEISGLVGDPSAYWTAREALEDKS
jgi:hypothetical protein